MKTRRLLFATATVGLTVSLTGQNHVAAYPYEVANVVPGNDADVLKIFPSDGSAITFALPFRFGHTMFGPDGKSLYVTSAPGHGGVRHEAPGLLKIEFNPIRANPVPGSQQFLMKSFAISVHQDKLVISGSRRDGPSRTCGVFEVSMPAGSVKQVLAYDCSYMWAWDRLSLSSDGEMAIASVGSNTTRDLHWELIDLVRGTTKPLAGDFRVGVWSPNGKWIATLGNKDRNSLSLMDAQSLSRRRVFGNTASIRPEWSPDSRYLLLWKYHPFRCGIGIDVEPPATLETLDIESGKRSIVHSSQCQVLFGSTGWVNHDLAK